MSETVHLTSREKTRLPEGDRSDAIRFCPKCGREIPPDRQVCDFCGNTGEIPHPSLPRRKKLLILVLTLLCLLILLTASLFLTRRAGLKPLPEILPSATPLPRGTAIPVILLP